MSDLQANSPALRLAQYLREFVSLRASTVRDVTKYDSVIWFGDMPQETECFSPAWVDGCETDDPWLEVRKQQFEPMPTPPKDILPWVDEKALKCASEQIPPLKLYIKVEDKKAQRLDDEPPPLVDAYIDDYPEIKASYSKYRSRWQNWSDEYRRRQKIQDLYARLFRLHTQQRKQGELFELVLGLGLLDWQAPVGGKVRRHVVTARVELEFKPDKGVMRIIPPSDGSKFHLEDDMLEVELRPDRSEYQAVQMQLDHIGDEIWDESLMQEALKHWAGALSADSLWSADLRPLFADKKNPTLSFAPALILRKRTQTGMVRIYDAMIQQLVSEKTNIPKGWGGLIDDIEEQESGGESNNQGLGQTSSLKENEADIYFPLAANKEQRRIVQAINRQRGVLVQGPPGTGKSHTIANLICHLLATGKRVLITAETSRALQVLKSKLPEEVQPLCVSLLGQGGDAFAELNNAVQGITTRQATYTPGDYETRIAEIESDLDKKRRQLAEIDSEIRSLREDETYPHQIADGAYFGSASAIAERVASERENYCWLKLPCGAKAQPPVGRDTILKWLEICGRYPQDKIEEAKLKLPASAELVDPEEFTTIVTKETAAKDDLRKFDSCRRHNAYPHLCSLLPEQLNELRQNLKNLDENRLELIRTASAWAQTALKDLLIGRRSRWEAILERSEELYTKAEALHSELGNVVITIPDTRDKRKVHADTQAAIAYLSKSGTWKRMGIFTPAELKGKTYLKEEIQVDGVGAATIKQLQKLYNELTIAFTLEELASLWCDVGANLTFRNRLFLFADIKEQHSLLEQCLLYADACFKTDNALAAISPAIAAPDWLDGEVIQWIELLDVAEKENNYNKTQDEVNKCAKPLLRIVNLHNAHPIVTKLKDAIEERNIHDYSQYYAELIAIEQLRDAQARRAAIEMILEDHIPHIVECILSSINSIDWRTRLSDWEKAWHWAVADKWLENRTDITYQQKLWRRRHETEDSLRGLIAETAALRAWKHFFSRLSAPESAALKSWREAVKAMGKGTGKSTKIARLRKEARKYMDACRDAIPIWVMPRYLVAEMINPSPERYDFVIVDEASQLGIDSLFLFYIAKKMVVVGDDQQISPYGIGIADKEIAGLQDHFLEGIPHTHALSAQSSLYGNAKIRFSQNIVLREHFRCMPEIIQFSNDLCYANNGTPLDPLRAYPANRLQPLVINHVADGYRTGSSQNAKNPPEADAIVAQIAGCIDDPRYDGKTMGVISLQGETQAKWIEKKLLGKLEPEVIEERKLICGDAYAFQGDERDIIFLSMVAAPGENRIAVLSKDTDRRRFNVAVSRAKDQLWLFHTATLDILRDHCMRYRLLKYMLDPKREVAAENKQKFDSEFERHVFKCITERGYFVRTQVCVGDPTNHRYRIDLVVEGMQGRLAVECDGDQWHGPDRYEYDMARQRDLERAGWQFVRIRGGDFYRDPETALKPVWAELERLGIHSGGIETTASKPPKPAVFDSLHENGLLEKIEGNEPIFQNTGKTKPSALRNHGNQPGTCDIQADSMKNLHLSNDNDTKARMSKYAAPSQQNLFNFPIEQVIDDKGRATYLSFVGEVKYDPRSPSVTKVNVAADLFNIIKAEAPILAKRAYDVYLRNCGIQRMGGELRKILDKALQHLLTCGRIISEDEYGKGELMYTIVRPKGHTAVFVRCRGPRSFSEIPPSEILTVANRMLASENVLTCGSDEHLRSILEYFDLQRLTTQVGTTLLDILEKKYPYVE